MLSSTVIPIPANEKDFEEKCVPLFAGILNDPNVKTFGARGMNQFGIDLLGRRNKDPEKPVGIQCKLKTKGHKLTATQVRSDVSAALTIRPALVELYVVTTASDDPALDQLALELSQEQRQLGRTIDIQVWGWETLQQRIRADQKSLNAFDPGHSPAADTLLEGNAELIALSTQHSAHHGMMLAKLTAIEATLASPVDTTRSAAFEAYLDEQIDHYRELAQGGKPRTALQLLETLEKGLPEGSSAVLRARVRANIGIAWLKLGEDERAGRLLVEAYALNPEDPKGIANHVLGQFLTGDFETGLAFARAAIKADPGNSGVAAFIFQGAAISDQPIDPLPLVPEALLNERSVIVNRINWLRFKRESGEWRAVAAEAYALYPDDPAVERLHAAALLDATLGERNFKASSGTPHLKLEMLRDAAQRLQRIWDRVKSYENARLPVWTTVACDLAIARSALGDLDTAAVIISEALRIAPADPHVLTTAAQVALDSDRPAVALDHLRKLPDEPTRLLMSLNTWSCLEDWGAIIAAATPDAREKLHDSDRQQFDILLVQARCASSKPANIQHEIEGLLAAWPDSVAAHAFAADIVRRHGLAPDLAEDLGRRARALCSDATSYGDRLMLAQCAKLNDDVDGVIAALDGHVQTHIWSEPLTWLAWAFANAPPRPRTRPFFNSLPAEIVETSQFARFAGAAEASRGDLVAAERHLRRAIAANARDLRAHLLLLSVLERDDRRDAARAHILSIAGTALDGSPLERVRLAGLLRRHGEAEQALALGYAAVIDGRDQEVLVAAYPGLIFLRDQVPESVDRTRHIAVDYWFDLAGIDVPDVQGRIEEGRSDGDRYAPEHPLAAAVIGKCIGDEVVLRPGVGPERRYWVREIKHKYIWLLHDIMQRHATLFPQSTSMFELSIKGDDVQPVLDFAREHSERGKAITQAYVDLGVPLAAVAVMGGKSTIELAEHLHQTGIPLQTCLGNTEERDRALHMTEHARAKGAVLDTLTVWRAEQFELLPALRSYFGWLAISRSTIDEILELREQQEINRGRETISLAFKGEQPVRDIRSPEDTERVIGVIDAALASIRANCKILPSDGADELRLDAADLGWAAEGQILDPVHLARANNLFFLSEDLRLRQLASHHGAPAGGWLQVVLWAIANAKLIDEAAYLVAIGQLAAMRHDHVWLDEPTLLGLLSIDDPRGEALFNCAIEYIGCRNAEIRSHMNVVREVMRAVWSKPIPYWHKERAIGKLLDRLIRCRSDWTEILEVLHFELHELRAWRARDYLIGWSRGHFLGLNLDGPGTLMRRRERPAR